MLARLNFLTVYLVMFILTFASAVIAPPLTEQAFTPDQTKVAMAGALEEVGK